MNAIVIELMRRVPVIALVSMRVALVLALMPAPFGELAPTRIRAALGFVIAMVISLAFFPRFPDLDMSFAGVLAYTVTELVIGAVMGLTVRVTLAASEIAGTVVGHAVGLGFAATIDPTFGDEGVPTTTLFSGLCALTFFAIGGHHLVFEALLASLETARPGQPLVSLNAPEVLGVGARMVAHGLRIASPVVATMFIVQVGTALVARSAPRVQIFALSFGVTITVGTTILVVGAPEMARAMAASMSGLLPTLISVLHGGGL
jgi:flagellar biosynthesis protein FliR